MRSDVGTLDFRFMISNMFVMHFQSFDVFKMIFYQKNRSESFSSFKKHFSRFQNFDKNSIFQRWDHQNGDYEFLSELPVIFFSPQASRILSRTFRHAGVHGFERKITLIPVFKFHRSFWRREVRCWNTGFPFYDFEHVCYSFPIIWYV